MTEAAALSCLRAAVPPTVSPNICDYYAHTALKRSESARHPPSINLMNEAKVSTSDTQTNLQLGGTALDVPPASKYWSRLQQIYSIIGQGYSNWTVVSETDEEDITVVQDCYDQLLPDHLVLLADNQEKYSVNS